MQVKKKLLITGSTFPRFAGDTEPRFLLDLAKSLQGEYEVTALVPAFPGCREQELLEGIRVERYHYFPIHKWETLCYPGAIVPRIKEKKVRILLVPFLLLGLYRALSHRKKDYDLVHANWLLPQGIVSSFVNIPYLLTGHGGDVASLNVWPLKALKRRAIRKAGLVTVVSAALKEKAVALFPEKEQEKISEKIVVQPLGCDLSRFSPRHRVENFFRQGGKKVVLFVGRLAEKKGVSYLIEAMKQVDGKLVIVGDGPLKPALEHQVSENHLEDKVQFLGARPHEELPAIYASADVFVAPSVTAGDGDLEGLGLVILEAFASGIPVAASKSGGIVDVITHEENGLLAKERDAGQLAACINRLLSEEELVEKITTNASETVKQYDYKLVGEVYGALIGFCDHSGVSG